jgi:hypothetical protein
MSVRKARRQLDRWHRYFRKYEPWHMATPGLLRAYNRWVAAQVHRKYHANRALQKP